MGCRLRAVAPGGHRLCAGLRQGSNSLLEERMPGEGRTHERGSRETDATLCALADVLHDMALAPERRETLLTVTVRALAQQHGLAPEGETLTALSEVLESARAVGLRLAQSEQEVARHAATLAAVHTAVVVAPLSGGASIAETAHMLGTLTDPVTRAEHALGAQQLPQRPRAPHEDTIAGALGLTPAEARLCALLADGRSPREAASLLGVKLTTVRTQLRAVFQKTHTRSQADLMRYLASLPSAR